MNIPNKFEQVSFFLAEYRLVTVLEEVTMAAVAAVKVDGMTGQQASH